mgnify:CR=1 FL=1
MTGQDNEIKDLALRTRGLPKQIVVVRHLHHGQVENIKIGYMQ